MIEQEGDLLATVPDYLLEILARFTRYTRENPAIDQRSGVSSALRDRRCGDSCGSGTAPGCRSR